MMPPRRAAGVARRGKQRLGKPLAAIKGQGHQNYPHAESYLLAARNLEGTVRLPAIRVFSYDRVPPNFNPAQLADNGILKSLIVQRKPKPGKEMQMRPARSD